MPEKTAVISCSPSEEERKEKKKKRKEKKRKEKKKKKKRKRWREKKKRKEREREENAGAARSVAGGQAGGACPSRSPPRRHGQLPAISGAVIMMARAGTQAASGRQ